MKFCRLRKSRAVYFTHCTLELMDSLGRVGGSMFEVGYDVFESAPEHPGHLLHGFQAAADGPAMPPAEVLTGRSLVGRGKEGHPLFLESPGPRGFQRTVAEGGNSRRSDGSIPAGCLNQSYRVPTNRSSPAARSVLFSRRRTLSTASPDVWRCGICRKRFCRLLRPDAYGPTGRKAPHIHRHGLDALALLGG
jgi:hypothetical protein